MKGTIQKGYLILSNMGWFEGVKELYEFTGIKPREGLIEERYEDAIKSKWGYSEKVV